MLFRQRLHIQKIEMKNIEFQIPKGYVIDMANSTEEKLVYKQVKSDNIMERIKTFEDACCELNLKQLRIENDTKDEVAYKKLKIIVRALNEGWKPDWTNSTQYKYWNYFYINSSGTFSHYSTYFNDSYLYVPSALLLKSKALAEHAAKVCFEEYKAFYMDLTK